MKITKIKSHAQKKCVSDNRWRHQRSWAQILRLVCYSKREEANHLFLSVLKFSWKNVPKSSDIVLYTWSNMTKKRRLLWSWIPNNARVEKSAKYLNFHKREIINNNGTGEQISRSRTLIFAVQWCSIETIQRHFLYFILVIINGGVAEIGLDPELSLNWISINSQLHHILKVWSYIYWLKNLWPWYPNRIIRSESVL